MLGRGEIRFQCQARDASVNPADQVNSFTGTESITPLPTTIGDITIKVLDQVYDWENPTPLTVLVNTLAGYCSSLSAHFSFLTASW